MSGSSSEPDVSHFPPDIEKNATLTNDQRHASTVSTFRHDDHNIYINDVPIDKDEFIYAFGGTLTSGAQHAPQRKFANVVPAGLAAFSCATFSLGLFHCHVLGVDNPTILLGGCFFCAGVTELVAGIWLVVVENTWAATVFLMFAGFWMSYACILTSGFGVAAAYASVEDYNNAVAVFLTPWAVFSFLLWITTFKSTVAMCLLMFLIWFFILLLTIAQYTGHTGVEKAGGVFCFLSGICGFYNCFAGMADTSNSYFVVPTFFMPSAARPPKKIE